MPTITKKLEAQPFGRIVIAEDINTDGAKRFLGFESIYDIFPYIMAQPARHFHEVMQGNAHRKIYFDADKKADEGEFPDIDKFVYDLRECVIMLVSLLFGVELDRDDICFTNSSTPDKFSAHAIVTSVNISVENMKLLHKLTAIYLTKQDPIYRTNDNRSILDPNIYKTNQNFRILNCSKMGKDNPKILHTTAHSELNTLVSYLGASQSIELLPNHQTEINKINADRLSSRYTNINNDPELFRQILNGLNRSRASNYGDWSTICLALGHSSAGVSIALEFASRAPNYNEAATIRTYEKGANYTGSKPCGIGTLFYMLKLDNIELFRQLTSVSRPTRDEPSELPHIDEIIEQAIISDPIKPTGAQKLSRWLSNPKQFLYKKTNAPENALTEADKIITYSDRFTQAYPVDQPTIFIKAQKGSGKTYAVEQYIKEHKPARIIYLSFRRTFTSELMKRLSSLDFVNYRDVEGPITDARVVIQVDSLHRLKSDERVDLLIIDEMESIRGQFFADTCKYRARVLDKYNMLLRTSNQVIAMDADMSYNSISLIRDARPGHVCYIDNTFNQIQSNFIEYYTTEMNRLMIEISKAAESGQRFVIPCNRSIEFMESLRQTLVTKYPKLKIQLYNSHTIRNPLTANELNDVESAWVKYDIVIYSPTVSAGVSFDAIHFDKCFCIFTNVGKVNSMRQMISRVRTFTTNEYYYCLQSFGGTDKPTNNDDYERYICSNRYIDKPEFIKSVDDFDGSRVYPYKDAGYHLWVCNQVETNIDKNKFVFNFICEQYHSGITNLQYMSDTDQPASAITGHQISALKCELKEMNSANIATASPITESIKLDICSRLDKEQPITDAERFSLARYNLLECYDIPGREINSEFVEVYNDKKVKSAYHNRKALARGLPELMESESDSFNELCCDNKTKLWKGHIIQLSADHQADLTKKYTALKMVIALELINITGFSGFYDISEISKDTMLKNFKDNEPLLLTKMDGICTVFGKDKRRRPDIASWPRATYFKKMIEFINSIIFDLFRLKIAQTGHRSGLYNIVGIEFYKFE